MLPPALLPTLSAQGLRTLVPTRTAPDPLLLPRLSTGRTTLATLAGRPTLPRYRSRQAVPTSAEPTLSPAPMPARRPPAAPHRGPAPSHDSQKIFGLSLRPPRLLPALCPLPPLSRPAVLLSRLPSGVTSRPPAAGETPAATPPRRTPPTLARPATAGRQARMSSRIFALSSSRYSGP